MAASGLLHLDEWGYRWEVAQLPDYPWNHYLNHPYSQYWNQDFAANLTRIKLGWTWNNLDGEGGVIAVWGTSDVVDPIRIDGDLTIQASPWIWEGEHTVTGLLFGIGAGTSYSGGVVDFEYVELYGIGDMPAFAGGIVL